MIQEINWSQPQTDESESPFGQGEKQRTLKITFHSESFTSPSLLEKDAIEMLRNFSNLSLVDAVDTMGKNLPKLTIGAFNITDKFIEVTVERNSGSTQSGIDNPRQWLEICKRICSSYLSTNTSDQEEQSMLQDILIARAHYQIDNDILVTLSPKLLTNRSNRWIDETNPLTPIEAVKLIGLFLRSKDNFTIGKKVAVSIGKTGFYWVLARNTLPAMWKYFSACVEKCKNSPHHLNNLSDTSGSILTRCARAFEARDNIGMQFYLPQGHQTRDCMMYHFDYLTLLLSGVFDAQALVAREVYGVLKPNERNTNFRNQEFVRNLRNNGGSDICNIIESNKFKDLVILLNYLRNSIHGSLLRSTGYKESSNNEQSFVYLHSDHSQDIWDAAMRYSSVENWGLKQSIPNLFEPYTYAKTLVEECFKYINLIAKATDVELLFSNQNIPKLLDHPPEEGNFKKDTRKCVEILG